MAALAAALPPAAAATGYAEQGVSPDASRIRAKLQEFRSDILGSIALGEGYQRAWLELLDAFVEGSSVWTQDDEAAPPSSSSLHYAARFLDELPRTLPAPEAGIDAEGYAYFEWLGDPGYRFSVTVTHDGALVYAGLFGSSRFFGTEPFNDSVPGAILEGIVRTRAVR